MALVNIKAATLNANTITKIVPVFWPLNRFVSRVNLIIGKYVSPINMLFEQDDSSDLHVHLTLFEKNTALVVVGQQVATFSYLQPND